MIQPDEFDAFYKRTRTRLLLQTYALTGDLPAARAAVRDSFIVTWHHWRKVNHIVHPRTGRPMRSNVSVSVFAQTCLQADALTKVVLLDEPRAWQALLSRENASAVFVTAKGEMVRFPAAA